MSETEEQKSFMTGAGTLAFIGDSVFEIYVRKKVVELHPGAKVNLLHRLSSAVVNCSSQARILASLSGELTESELAVVRRGRNSKPHSFPKNADIHDYLEATGFEALLGYLEFSGNKERLLQLLHLCDNMITEFIDGAAGSPGEKK